MKMAIEITTLLTLIVSLIVVIKSADYAVQSISSYARTVGISDYLIGFLIVSVGTSLPELSTAITASLAKAGTLVVGDVFGANIIDITVVLGLMAIVGRKIKLKSNIAGDTFFVTIAVAMLPLLLGVDGVLGRFDGFVLIVAFVLYIIRLWNKEGKLGRIKKDVPFAKIYKDMLVFGISVPVLLLSANYLVGSAIKLAQAFNVSPILIGITVIAIGTTTPELSVEIKSVLKGHKDVGFGDLIGSVMVNSSLVLGLAAIINPITFQLKLFLPAASFMITSLFIGLLFLKNKHNTWQEGIGLLLLYATFILTEVVFA